MCSWSNRAFLSNPANHFSWSRFPGILLALLALVSPFLRSSPVQAGVTFVVNSTGDETDSYLPDGICDTKNYPLSDPPIPPSGICTLRAAIMQANSTTVSDTIIFNIGGGGVSTIIPATVLPTISKPLTIDGTTQLFYVDYPIIRIDGSGIPPPGPTDPTPIGLLITAGNSTVRGLAIYGFKGEGILLLGPAGGNVIEGNYIGLYAGSIFPEVIIEIYAGNGLNGVRIDVSSNNIIGGTTATARNVITGNIENGINILGYPGFPASGNKVMGNFIGTNPTGTEGVGNTLDGVHIHGAAQSIIGGAEAGARNIISGNKRHGVMIHAEGATENKVQSNYIGTDVTGADLLGASHLGNTMDGVFIDGVPGNIIGGAETGVRNVITGNKQNGVRINGIGAQMNKVQGNYIGTDALGTAKRGNSYEGIFIENAPKNVIGGSSQTEHNIISGNGGNGVKVSGSDAKENLVQGNSIGPNALGTEMGNTLNGIFIAATGSNTVGGILEGSGNNIAWNKFNGIFIDSSTSILVQGNQISDNTQHGVNIIGGGATVGGTETGTRNIISGNKKSGVSITGNGNKVQGNYIGVNAQGTAEWGNTEDGIVISGLSTGNIIGGTVDVARNIISGNKENGIKITNGPSATLVQHNYIGINAQGTAKLGNWKDGVLIYRASTNTIGGTETGARNIISGNSVNGVQITGTGFSFDANSGSVGNKVQGNYIGTDAEGMLSLDNLGQGLLISNNARDNIIGGIEPGARNVISGNYQAGVKIARLSASDPPTNNLVQGNFIGTDKTGAVKLGNKLGVFIVDASSNTIGGTTAMGRNVISGNITYGVYIKTEAGAATLNKVQGNYIGVDVTGAAKLGNTEDGMRIEGTSNTIGGTEIGARNIISGNNSGVNIVGAGHNGNMVQGNYIGTDVTGTVKLGNSVGVIIKDANTNNIEGNMISGNNMWGVEISGVTATENKVLANSIGTDTTGGNNLGNGGYGIFIRDSASKTTIGGTGLLPVSNSIAHNGAVGIFIESGDGNHIFKNSIFSNAGLGIDLGVAEGVTANDSSDNDVGPNGLQNFPVVNSALNLGSQIYISGTFSSKPNSRFTLDFYSNIACNPSGFGEGQNYIGNATGVVTNGSGTTTFAGLFPLFTVESLCITATATDADGNTSEFSKGVLVTAPPGVPGDVNGDKVVNLADAILAFHVTTGIQPEVPLYLGNKISGNNKIGVEDIVYILQKIAGIR